MNTTVSTNGDKAVIRYLCMVALWYMLCPLGAVLLLIVGGQYIRYYEGVVGVFGLCCVISEVYRHGTLAG